MDTEIINREKQIAQDSEKALKDIKDSAVMLSLASEYLCEDPFLEKIGTDIEKNIEIVKTHVEDLKKQFVGKPVAEVDLKKPVDRVARFAGRLQNASDGTRQKCTQGELGEELDESVKALINEIDALKERIEGRSVSYTAADSALGFLGRFKFIVRSLVVTSKFTLRISALFVIICLMIFVYLFITMETEKVPLERVEQSRALILQKQADLVRIKAELKPLREKIESARKDEMSRQEEIRFLDLSLKAHKLAEDYQETLIELDIEEKALKEKLKELEAVQRKSFLERLLRIEP
jgi:hypothetical protein